jgi:hypothetical protein
VILIWDYPAQWTWKQLDPADAYVVARAAHRFAEAGEGDVRWTPPYFRLRAGRFELELTITEDDGGTVSVHHIYRARMR